VPPRVADHHVLADGAVHADDAVTLTGEKLREPSADATGGADLEDAPGAVV